MSFIQFKTEKGQPLVVGQHTLIPVAKSVCLRLPKIPIGFVWHRPTGVIVQARYGQEYELPIQDVTGRLYLLLLGIALLTMFIAVRVRFRKS